jgi:hypothetical protein
MSTNVPGTGREDDAEVNWDVIGETICYSPYSLHRDCQHENASLQSDGPAV